jgi:hypothetical protein
MITGWNMEDLAKEVSNMEDLNMEDLNTEDWNMETSDWASDIINESYRAV